MRIGINGSSDVMLGKPLDAIVQLAVDIEQSGLEGFSVGQFPASDALVILGAVAARTSTVELTSAAVTTWQSHPSVMAAQALTLSGLSSGRFVLGLGAGHQRHVEDQLRVPFDAPAARFLEFLSILQPAMDGKDVDFSGRFWSAHTRLGTPSSHPAPAVLAAAMGPRMLDVAGRLTDGVVLWLAGPGAIRSAILPKLIEAAESAGRNEPRVMASVPVAVTDDPESARIRTSAVLESYTDLPSYRRILSADGSLSAGDVAIIGSEDEVLDGLSRFAEAGCTDFHATIPPIRSRGRRVERDRTLALLSEAVGQF